MLKPFVLSVAMAGMAGAGLAQDHSAKAEELNRLIEERGPSAAVVAGIVIGSSMAPDKRAEFLSRIGGGEDSMDICAWCGCCKVENDMIVPLGVPGMVNVDGLLDLPQ